MMEINNEQIRILLIDDTPVNLEIAGKTLEKEGYDLYIADNGYSALELIGKTNFDLILLDIMMPEMDGFETLIKIRQIKNCKNTPVIFLTAKVDIESVIRGFELGAIDYIRKPFNELELKARVRIHVELKKIREELEEKNKSLEEAYGILKVAATTDPLTHLLNRREMSKRMETAMLQYERYKHLFSIIIADIDFFKKVNDTYGHERGDSVLVTVAEILLNSARKTDSISRWGGEEFLLLLPETNAAGAAKLAEKIRKNTEKMVFHHGEAEFNVTMTCGICEFDGNMALDELISNADKALYDGKANGRNRCVIFS